MNKIRLECEVNKHDLASFHDCVFDATGEDLNKYGLMEVFHSLPATIKAKAYQFGMSDTVFRDDVYQHLVGK